MARARRSVRGKLMGIVLLTTGIALLVAGTAMLMQDLGTYRRSWASDLATQANILASSTIPALAFDDHEAAERALAALHARPEVRVAALYQADGNLYAQYRQSTVDQAPPHAPLIGSPIIAGDRVEVTARLAQRGEFLGTLYLRASYDIAGRVKAYVGIFAIVIVLSMSVAIVLSSRLQQIITAPLDAMAKTATQIVDRRDYSLRAKKSSDDEIGFLVDAFNAMLDEVQLRTQALEESNRAMRESEKLYRAIGESIDYGVWVCAADGRNIYASDSFLRLTGITQAQCADFGWAHRLPPADLQATLQAWKLCVRTGGTWYREHQILGTDGKYHPVLAQGVPIRDDNGAISGWAGINLDISRLKQTEDALRQADRRKDEFLATLAHELRNPLAPIQHAVKIMELASSDAEQRRWAREVIARQTQRMALLLDDLLDVSRITSGRLSLKKSYQYLEALVTTAIETARPLIERKRHRLEVKLPQHPIELEVDPLRLSQALSNLLTNAAKYTDPGGCINVTATLESGALRITVEDSGVGISADAISHVFEMFSQVESAIDRTEGGLGIGLALVKGLVTLHGGEVRAHSAGLGQGSTFTIQLPGSALCARSSSNSTSKGNVSGSGATGKVMVVDDNIDGARTLALVLELSGYEVCVARSGKEALTIGARERPDAVILDIGMPEMNGYEIARRMRAETWGSQAYLLALTGWGQEDDKERAKAAGFDIHLTKPVDIPQLEALLTTFMTHHRQGERSVAPLPTTNSTRES
jgi:PAS domain S-box-containing protein